MNKIILIIIVIIIIVIGGYFIYYFYGSSIYKTNNPSETNIVPNTNTPVINQQQNQPENLTSAVTIENFSFNPATLTIKKGATVIWTNQDNVPHKIKSDTFNSSVLNKGDNFQFTFLTVGEYNYSCSIHPSMQGKIIVTQ